MRFKVSGFRFRGAGAEGSRVYDFALMVLEVFRASYGRTKKGVVELQVFAGFGSRVYGFRGLAVSGLSCVSPRA